jgi:hypothetical protein
MLLVRDFRHMSNPNITTCAKTVNQAKSLSHKVCISKPSLSCASGLLTTNPGSSTSEFDRRIRHLFHRSPVRSQDRRFGESY